MIDIAPVRLPDFGVERTFPPLPLDEYEARLGQTVGRMKALGLDVLLVYADREHAATIAFLTGFDPRFEEGLLLLDVSGRRLLLVGNECLGYLPDPALRCEVELFQELSLMGQQRDGSKPLRQIFSRFGIRRGTRLGCAGWKHFEGGSIEDSGHALEIPAYLVDLLRDLAGDRALVRNATAIFMNPIDGLRIINSAPQLAQFEFASIRTSESIKSAIQNLRAGVTEEALERCMHGGGLPRSCHAMVSFGEKARRGLSSPSQREAALGDPYTAAYGIQGALTCRAGMVARAPEDLPDQLRSFYHAFVSNYFDVVAAWYHSVRVGATAGEVVAAVESVRDPTLLRFAANPGHYIHLDEWVHSPFSSGSGTSLRPGMALQMDIIPISAGPFCCTNAEDGVVLADERLRTEIASRYPAMWTRVMARRDFMRDAIGIDLDPSVLPLSNIPAWLPPYALDPEHALIRTASRARGA
jgi:Xaa-Pro aminopeptidase